MSFEYFKAEITKRWFKPAGVFGQFDYDQEKGLYIAYSSDEILIPGNRFSHKVTVRGENFCAMAEI